MNDFIEVDDDTVRQLKDSISNSTYFKKFEYLSGKSDDPFDHIIGIVNPRSQSIILGPSRCSFEELKTLVLVSLGFEIRPNADILSSLGDYLVNELEEYSQSVCNVNSFTRAISQTKAFFDSTIPSESELTSQDSNGNGLEELLKVMPSFGRLYSESHRSRESIDAREQSLAILCLSYLTSKAIQNDEVVEGVNDLALFPAHWIFELFLNNACKDTVNSRYVVKYQESTKYISKMPDKEPLFIRPDVSIYRVDDNSPVLAFDAKFKKFNRSECYNDIRQVTTYIRCLNETPGYLVYPSYLNDNIRSSSFYDKKWKIGFIFLDIINYSDDLNKIISGYTNEVESSINIQEILDADFLCLPKKQQILRVLLESGDWMTRDDITNELHNRGSKYGEASREELHRLAERKLVEERYGPKSYRIKTNRKASISLDRI